MVGKTHKYPHKFNMTENGFFFCVEANSHFVYSDLSL